MYLISDFKWYTVGFNSSLTMGVIQEWLKIFEELPIERSSMIKIFQESKDL